jgi:hypothetical protein
VTDGTDRHLAGKFSRRDLVFLIQCVDEVEPINIPKMLISVDGPFHDNKI